MSTIISTGDLGPLTDQPETEVGIDVGPDDIGTLSFTSGSTGKPKAVRGRHISLTHFYPWMRLEFGLSELDRYVHTKTKENIKYRQKSTSITKSE